MVPMRRSALHPPAWAGVARVCAGALLAVAGWAARATEVSMPGPAGVTLKAEWLAADAAGPLPVVLALHGCGGLYNGKGQLAARYRDYAQWLNQRGYHALMLDSFGSRGLGSQCSTRYGARSVTVGTRRQDALAALEWLRAQPRVDAARVALLGWSNGATTALAVLDTARGDVPALAGAVAFYPGCGGLEKRAAALSTRVPLLMLLGSADDWTPPAPCRQLAAAQQAKGHGDVTLREYAGAYHGFDGTDAVRFRTDVPNGTSRDGVHQGGNAAARAQALAELDGFLSRAFAPATR
jgi:dienelactone hydrolase